MEFYGVSLGSRLLLGTAGYPSPAILAEAVRRSGAEVVTVAVVPVSVAVETISTAIVAAIMRAMRAGWPVGRA